MDSSDPVHLDEDARTIIAASLALGKDEVGIMESLSNYANYEGRRLKTNGLTPGSLGRGGDAWVSIRGLDR